MIFSIGNITDTSKEEAEKLQEQTNIPVIVIDGSIDKAATAYEFLGKILGEEKRAKELGDYCDKVFKDVVEKVKKVPEEKRISIYYAEANTGLSTEPETSSHAAVFKYANAKNVATVEGKKGSGMSPVSLEQVLAWNPQVIVSWSDDRGGAFSAIKNSPDWSNIDAVKNQRVYEMPDTPFTWLDRPPSVNRFIGIQWMANLLYPDDYPVDIKAQTKEFYKLFYHIDLNDQEVNTLLKNAV